MNAAPDTPSSNLSDSEWSTQSHASTTDIYLEREGERLLGELAEAADQLPWGLNLLQIAWTAGPVTFIAAAGGYYIGYGKSLPTETLIFFIGYTVLAGLVGLAANLVHKLTRERRTQQREAAFTCAIDRISELLFRVADLELAQLNPDQRRLQAAGRLLSRAELTPASTALAVEELTDSRLLADIAHRLELYRRNGLESRCADLREQAEPQIRLALDHLNGQSPELAERLRTRLDGIAPNLRNGVARERHFIEHILSAMERDNPALITLADLEALLQLTFELLNGRRFTLLGFVYRGHWRMARAADELERARHRYNIARATSHSRLKSLAAWLVESDGTELETPPGGRQTQRLLDEVQAALDALAERLRQLRRRLVKGDSGASDELTKACSVMETALGLFRILQQSHAELTKRRNQLIRARRRWEELDTHNTRLRTRDGRLGLRIIERSIGLDDEHRFALSEAIGPLLAPLCRPVEQPIETDEARQLAIDLMLELERFMHLTHPEVQRAIDNADGAHFGLLEPGLNPSSKIAHGSNMVKELRSNMARSAERLAADLVRHYNVTLDDAAIRFLADNYAADPELLAVFARVQEEPPLRPDTSQLALPPSRIRLRLRWRLELDRARTLLDLKG